MDAPPGIDLNYRVRDFSSGLSQIVLKCGCGFPAHIEDDLNKHPVQCGKRLQRRIKIFIVFESSGRNTCQITGLLEDPSGLTQL